jgi:hypothetical protein
LFRHAALTALILLILVPGSLLMAAGDTVNITIVIADVVAVDATFVPTEYKLHPPYPNPFNPDVNITVDIPEEAHTRIAILNLRGQEVTVLENSRLRPGRYEQVWHAQDYPSGLYFVRVRSAQFESVQKISLLK